MSKPKIILTRLLVWCHRCVVKSAPLLLSIFLSFSTGYVYANPTGGEVVAGSASISSSATRMDINQHSDRAVLNWQDFSIDANEQVNFNQPGKGSVALNRVVGANISNIQGQLTANGNVFIVNRNGVIFGANSRVDVNGLMATTSAIGNEDFMAGRMKFSAPGGDVGSIVNDGTITVAQGGLVAFVAPSVRNAGVINARLGRVALAAGEQFTLDMYGDDLIKLAVSDDLAGQLVENSGAINADGGVVSLTASQAKSAADAVINMSGTIQAKSIAQRDGKIILSAGEGSVEVAGTLDTGNDSGVGGDIDVLGSRINLTDKAILNASGAGGGGEVHIGGDYQGKGSRQRAIETQIAAGAQVEADATSTGNGGRIIVWSDYHTVVDGSLSARGGQIGGDGGLIETSSAGKLGFSRQAKVEARGKGKPGTWLLDPEDITIGSGQANAISSTLNNGGNVSIKTADQGNGEGNIKVNAPITKTKGGDASLSMQAHNNIDVNAPISSTSGKLNVNLKAGRSINVNAAVSTNGGGFSTSITGVQPTDTNDGGSTDESTDDTNAQDETTNEEQIADNSDATQADESPASDQITDVTDEAQTDETIAGQTEDQSTQEAIDQVTTTVATTDVTVNQPVAAVQPPAATGDTATLPSPTVAHGINTQTPVTAVEPKAQASTSPVQVVDQSSVGVTINETVNSSGGSIAIDAGTEGTATINSSLNSSNPQTGKVGGEIEVLGHKVVLTKKAKLDASGDAGGGDVKVGGAYQGKGDTRTAIATTVAKGASIKSNAITKGNGGEVVVWADQDTDYQGHIEARGGKLGGDGGSVEVSGKQNLKFNGTVDTSAAKGKTGTLLLDPTDLTITNTGSATDTVNVLDVATINSLGANNDVTVQVTEDIVFARFDNGASVPQDVAVTLAQTLGKTVAFKSTNGSIVFANPGDTLETSGANLEFEAGDQLTLGNLKTKGGKVDLIAGSDVSLQKIDTRVNPKGVISTDIDPNFKRDEVGNDITITSTSGDVVLNDRINTGTRNVTIEALNGDIIGVNEGIIDTLILSEISKSTPGLQFFGGQAGSVKLSAQNINFSQIDLQALRSAKPAEYSIGTPDGRVFLDHVNFGQLNLTTSDSIGEQFKKDQFGQYQYIDNGDGFSIKGEFFSIGRNEGAFPGKQLTINLAGMQDAVALDILDENFPVSGTDSSGFRTYIGTQTNVGASAINPQIDVTPGSIGIDTISCPPCIAEPQLPTPPVPPRPSPAIVDNTPPTLPEITIIEPIASSSEIDRESDRRIIIHESSSGIGGIPVSEDECAAYDTLSWLALGPNDATSSVDLGRSSSQSSQSDIQRSSACLNRVSQASL